MRAQATIRLRRKAYRFTAESGATRRRVREGSAVGGWIMVGLQRLMEMDRSMAGPFAAMRLTRSPPPGRLAILSAYKDCKKHGRDGRGVHERDLGHY